MVALVITGSKVMPTLSFPSSAFELKNRVKMSFDSTVVEIMVLNTTVGSYKVLYYL